MRLGTRAFLVGFVPLAILLAASSLIVQQAVQSTVRDGVRSSLRRNQLVINRIQVDNNLQNRRFLGVVGDNAALKAGLELIAAETDKDAARRTVDDQLLELGEHMGFDLLLITAPDGSLLAGVARGAERADGKPARLLPLQAPVLPPTRPGVLMIRGRLFQVAAMPIETDGSSVGALFLGERLDLAAFGTPTVLLHNGSVVMSSVSGIPNAEIQTALTACTGGVDCHFRLHGSDWMSLAAPLLTGNDEYVLRSLEDVDLAVKPIRSGLQRIFLLVAFCSLLIVFICSAASSRWLVRPIAGLVAHMRGDAQHAELTSFTGSSSAISELRELEKSYNRAAHSVRQSGESLQAAYVEFVGALASALDARDPYTAGHSRRVSEVACAIASALSLPPQEVERIRTGALLHDIGKIGVSDQVLQKAGCLTAEEFDAIRQHPVIGRRILEGVQGFAPFLSAVELHHENWDGTGYPTRQAGEQVPLDARIIHVADAYDAMTTDRSYRKGMTHAKAVSILETYAGTQFDPKLVEVFISLSHTLRMPDALPLAFAPTEEQAVEVA